MNNQFFSNLLKITTQSSDLSSFCRNAIHNLWPSLTYSSIEFFSVSPDGFLERSAGYFIDGPKEESLKLAFAEDHPACLAAKTGQPVFNHKKDKCTAIPARSGGWLQGVLVLRPFDAATTSVDENELTMLTEALSSFVTALSGTRRGKSELGNIKPESLTARQMQVLRGMHEGLIYAQIASNLHVSESLVKLEVTRIFRFLGVSGRAAAILSSREMLSETTPPPRAN